MPAGRARLRFARAAERFLAGRCFDVVVDMGDGWHADVFMPHHGTHEPNTKPSRFGGVKLVWLAVTYQLTGAPGSGPPE